MPTPMLKVFSISACGTLPTFWIRRKIGPGTHVPRDSSATSPVGMTRARLPARPPPVTWQKVCTSHSSANAKQSLA